MNFEQWRFLLFALGGLLSIVLFSLLGASQFSEIEIDRHTGRTMPRIQSAAEALTGAFEGKTARDVLDRIGRARRRWGADPALKEAQAILAVELDTTGKPPPDDHPLSERVIVDRDQKEQFAGALHHRRGERLPRSELLELLRGVEGDRAIAESTQALFAVTSGRTKPDAAPNSDVVGADRLAHQLRLRVDDAPYEVTPSDYLEAAAAFHAEARPRARVRWLLNAYEAHPGDAEVRDALLAAYLETSRHHEAFALLGAEIYAGDDDPSVWAKRTEIAGWLSLPVEEAEALEQLVGDDRDEQRRERLIAIYRYIGKPELALSHARVLAKGSDDVAVRERAVNLALEAGMIDVAFEELEHLAATSEDPTTWRERIVTLAIQDARLDRAIDELRGLTAEYPRRGYHKQLEALYRRLGRDRELLELLEERLARNPDDEGLEAEMLALVVALDDRGRVREILVRQLNRTQDPVEFFEKLPYWRHEGFPNLPDHARRIIEGPDLAPEHVQIISDVLRLYRDDPEYLALEWILAGRHVDAEGARALYVELIDRPAAPEARASLAKEVARRHPDDTALARIWMERAAWAGMTDDEVAAREALLRSDPDDAENLRSLGDLYEAIGRHDDAASQWLRLAEREGPGSDVAMRLVNALFHLRRVEEAMSWLERRAALPGSTVEDRLFVAQQLFGAQQLDQALVFYAAVLDEDPNNADALLRVGQIRSWSSDPHGAIPFLKHRLKVSQDDVPTVQFYLGEAYWSVKDEDSAREQHEAMVPALLAAETRTLEQDSMLAKTLTRLGRGEEAIPMFDRLLEINPDAVDLILDYADAMTIARRLEKADELVGRARELEPKSLRAMRLQAQVYVAGKRHTEAVPVLEDSLEIGGPDAGLEADLGYALELTGDWREAVDAYTRSLALQPKNYDVALSRRRLNDKVRDAANLHIAYAEADDDRIFDAVLGASVTLDERTRLFGGVGYHHLSGRAAAVDNGATDVKTDYASLDAALCHRRGGSSWLGGGLSAYPGADGDFPLGAWAGLHLQGGTPFHSLNVRAWGHELWRNPPAAAGFGGRTSGGRVAGYQEFARRWWVSGSLDYEWLSIDEPDADDGFFNGQVTVGAKLRKGEAVISEGLSLHRCPAGPFSADLGARADRRHSPDIAVWLSYEAMRLFGDKELAVLLPIGTRFNYLSVGGRVDVHLREGLGVRVSGAIGRELVESSDFYNVEGAVTWRPREAFELYGGIAAGTTQGRSDDANFLAVRFGLSYRW